MKNPGFKVRLSNANLQRYIAAVLGGRSPFVAPLEAAWVLLPAPAVPVRAPHAVALQVCVLERQTSKPGFHLMGYRLWGLKGYRLWAMGQLDSTCTAPT